MRLSRSAAESFEAEAAIVEPVRLPYPLRARELAVFCIATCLQDRPVNPLGIARFGHEQGALQLRRTLSPGSRLRGTFTELEQVKRLHLNSSCSTGSHCAPS